MGQVVVVPQGMEKLEVIKQMIEDLLGGLQKKQTSKASVRMLLQQGGEGSP